jgi:hypothetical protein
MGAGEGAERGLADLAAGGGGAPYAPAALSRALRAGAGAARSRLSTREEQVVGDYFRSLHDAASAPARARQPSDQRSPP